MSDLHPKCPRCGREARWIWAEQRCLACGFGDAAAKPKHRARALQALAAHLCGTHLTDGFCSPCDGACQQHVVLRCRRQDLDCMIRAEGLMKAMESVGCKVVWAFDRERGG